jgi:hypothetical protein
MLSYDAFKKSLSTHEPPSGLPILLKAMWYDGKGDWHTAHELAQDVHSREGSWIHAYLHRKEGDLGNAGYWYNRAGKNMPASSLEAEWEFITHELLQNQ